jgi:hypothetical protein
MSGRFDATGRFDCVEGVGRRGEYLGVEHSRADAV